MNSTAVNGRRGTRDITRQSLHELLSGLEPGQKIPVERKLAQMFSTSRDTVRAVE